MDALIHFGASEDWEVFKQVDDFTGSRKHAADRFTLKGECVIPLAPPPIIEYIQEVSNKPKYVDEIEVVEKLVKLDENVQVVYNRIATPPIVWTRDAVFVQGVKEVDGTYYLATKSFEFEEKPPVDGYVRVDINIAGFIIKPVEAYRSVVTYIMNVNPGGWVPSFVINMVQKKQAEAVLRLRDCLLS